MPFTGDFGDRFLDGRAWPGHRGSDRQVGADTEEVSMAEKTTALRRLLAEEAFIHIPVAYDALGGRLIEQTGFKAAYVGGFVTGGSRCTSEPLLTLDEQ